MTTNGKIAVPIRDRNGKNTTVWKNPDGATSSVDRVNGIRSVPLFGIQAASDEILSMPDIKINTNIPTAIRRKMKDIVFDFATADGGETSIAMPRLSNDAASRKWAVNQAQSGSVKNSDRYWDIARLFTEGDGLKRQTEARQKATAEAHSIIGHEYPAGTMLSLIGNGDLISRSFPDLTHSEKGKLLKDRLGLAIIARGVKINDVEPHKFWEAYEAYSDSMEDAIGDRGIW